MIEIYAQIISNYLAFEILCRCTRIPGSISGFEPREYSVPERFVNIPVHFIREELPDSGILIILFVA